MSRPSASLLFAILRTLLRGSRETLTPGENAPKKSSASSRPPDAVAQTGEDLGALLHREAEREEDLPLGLHAALLARLDAIDGRLGHAGASRQLRLGHQLGLAESLHVVHRACDLHLRSNLSRVIRVGVKQQGCIERALSRQYNSTAPASRKASCIPTKASGSRKSHPGDWRAKARYDDLRTLRAPRAKSAPPDRHCRVTARGRVCELRHSPR